MDRIYEKLETFIANELGINMCAVKDIQIGRQPDGQLTTININFVPSEKCDEVVI